MGPRMRLYFSPAVERVLLRSWIPGSKAARLMDELGRYSRMLRTLVMQIVDHCRKSQSPGHTIYRTHLSSSE